MALISMRAALRGDATHVRQMDPDLSHNPGDVPRLLAQATDGDLVIGSRHVPGAHRELAGAEAAAERVCESIRPCDYGPARSGLHERVPLLSPQRPAADAARAHRLRRLLAFLVELVQEAHAAYCHIVGVPITVGVPMTFVERSQSPFGSSPSQ